MLTRFAPETCEIGDSESYSQLCTWSESCTLCPDYAHSSLKHVETVDLFFHGRGFRSMWQFGAIDMLVRGPIQIRNIYGYSFGALNAIAVALSWSLDKQLKLYEDVFRLYKGKKMDLQNILFSVMTLQLPVDAYRLCTGRVFIGYSTTVWKGLRYRQQSTFVSNHDLIQCVCKSTRIPGITTRRPWNGVLSETDGAFGFMLWGYDCFVQNKRDDAVPIIQLWPPNTLYPHVFSPTDTHIELKILQGMLDMRTFWKHGMHSNIELVSEPSTRYRVVRMYQYLTKWM